MTWCERCGRAEAVVTVARLTVRAANRVGNARHLCDGCAWQEGVQAGMADPGPPPEPGPAGAERFRPLHAHALRVLARLEATYEVTPSGAFPSFSGVLFPPEALQALGAPALPPVLLTPRLPEAAPLAVAFTTPPGLVVRCGRWHEAAFGAASGAGARGWTTLASETESFEDLIGKVVDGLFTEAVRLPLVGRARLSTAFGDGTRREGLGGEGWMLIPRARARALFGAGPRAVHWRTWPRRRLWSGADAPAVDPGSAA